ncbi:MAG: DEAD/DEAH box helicase [Bacteroidota bacterium]|nr:DEAD/DEAH box helicase [Bacteroidota bacterium]
MTLFENFELSQPILSAIEELGFITPTPIQEKVIPHLLTTTSDMIGLAQTGTGKTAAFGLPLLETIKTSFNKPQVLVLSPTRELSMQIADDFMQFGKNIRNLNIAAVYGGASIEQQIRTLDRGAHIVVGTPGRVKDLINRRKLHLDNINTLVLDEADEMLNMGFRDELSFIMESMPDDRRTLLFTATMEGHVREVAKEYLKDAIEISAGGLNTGAENVSHEYYMVQARNKYAALRRIIDSYPKMYAIMFCRTRQETKDLSDHLIRDGYSADALHGDLSQSQRDFVMKRFRYHNINILVATDVAARGLDVDDLTHVINFNLPDEDAAYIHRSGRTGRAGKKGISISIINLKEKGWISRIEKRLKKPIVYKPIPTGKEVCEKQLLKFIDRLENCDTEETQVSEFLPAIQSKLEWMDKEMLLNKLVSLEFNLFLSEYSNAPDLNITRDEFSKDKRKARSTFSRFFINVGQRDGFIPPKLIGLINDSCGRRDIPIGKIDIQRNFSFFEVDSSCEKEILDAFRSTNFEGRDLNVEVAQPQPERERPFREKKFKKDWNDSGNDRSRRSPRSGSGSREGSREGSSYGKRKRY